MFFYLQAYLRTAVRACINCIFMAAFDCFDGYIEFVFFNIATRKCKTAAALAACFRLGIQFMQDKFINLRMVERFQDVFFMAGLAALFLIASPP